MIFKIAIRLLLPKRDEQILITLIRHECGMFLRFRLFYLHYLAERFCKLRKEILLTSVGERCLLSQLTARIFYAKIASTICFCVNGNRNWSFSCMQTLSREFSAGFRCFPNVSNVDFPRRVIRLRQLRLCGTHDNVRFAAIRRNLNFTVPLHFAAWSVKSGFDGTYVNLERRCELSSTNIEFASQWSCVHEILWKKK